MALRSFVMLPLMLVASSSWAKPLITTENDYKGYPKRDRLSLTSHLEVSPSQLHEVYGSRLEAGVSYLGASHRLPAAKATVAAPAARARALVGGDLAVFGIGFIDLRSRMVVGADGLTESYRDTKIIPQGALTLANHLTIGVAADMTTLELTERQAGRGERDFSYSFSRETIGMSLHQPKFEVGVIYTNAGRSSDANAGATAIPSFSLATRLDATRRAIYLAPHFGAYVRGNLTDTWSVLAKVAHTEYDADEPGALKLFSKYKPEDRVSTLFQTTYWFEDRSRVSGSLLYHGAAHAPAGTVETGLGYQVANRYGVGLDATRLVAERTYVGLSIDYTTGRRDETVDGVRYAAEEDRFAIGTSISANL